MNYKNKKRPNVSIYTLYLIHLTSADTHAFTPTKGARHFCNFLFGALLMVTLGEAGKSVRERGNFSPKQGWKSD